MFASSNFRAAIFMMLAMGLFTLGDSITKLLSTQMNIGQYMFIRGAFATIIVGLYAYRKGSLKRIPYDPMTALRIAGELVATTSYIYALTLLSQGFAAAVFQATPILVTLAAVIFLGEKVGWRRWLCVFMGLFGVMIILNPSGNNEITLLSFCVLFVSMIAAVVRDIATRRVPSYVPTLYISTLTSLALTLAGAALLYPLGGWTTLEWYLILLCLVAAILLLLGYNFIIIAMREGEISFVSPFRYTSLVWAIFLSFIIFGDIPSFSTIVGAIIVILSGVYMVYRESVLNKRLKQRSTLATTPTGVGTNP